MCGIAGIISNKAHSSSAILAMLEHQKKRGPDYQNHILFQEPDFTLTLGHNRLKIIDLSDQANQPMQDSSERYTIVFNGEIYNYLELKAVLAQLGYIFHTNGDTEVILNAFAHWGADCVKYFRGPFAFAIYDKSEKDIWLFRDRFGVKPLYFYQTSNTFYFSSLPAAIGKLLNLEINLEYAIRGLQYWVYDDDSEITPFKGLNSLEPGHCLKLSYCSHSKSLIAKKFPYYNLAAEVERKAAHLHSAGKDAIIEEFLEMLNNAVSIRLRADVDIGISLSGGLDSTTVSHIAHSFNNKICGFTFGSCEDPANEAAFVKKIYHNHPIKIHYVWPKVQEISDALIHTLKNQEAPFTTASIIAQNLVYQKAKTEGIKVILGGQGADEAFMGYRKFFIFWLRELIQQRNFMQAITAFRQIIQVLFAEQNRLLQFWNTRFRYQKNLSSQQLLNASIKPLNLNKTSSIMQRQIDDVSYYSLPTLLRYEDRNSLGNGIESRLPFLDHDLVSFGIALPIPYKLNKGYGKWLIRDAMKNHIPKEIAFNRGKTGFDFNLKYFITNGLGSSIRENLNEYHHLFRSYLNQPIFINKYFSDQQLLNNNKTFSEAITLLWLSRQYF